MNAQVQALANNRIRVSGNPQATTTVRVVIRHNGNIIFDQAAHNVSGQHQQDVPATSLAPGNYDVRVFWDNDALGSIFQVTLNGADGQAVTGVAVSGASLMVSND